MWPFKPKSRRKMTDWYENMFNIFSDDMDNAEGHIDAGSKYMAGRSVDRANTIVQLIVVTFPDRLTVREGEALKRWNYLAAKVLGMSDEEY